MKMDFVILCLLKTDLELIGQNPKRIYIFCSCYVFLLQEVWVIIFVLVLIKSEGMSCDNIKNVFFMLIWNVQDLKKYVLLIRWTCKYGIIYSPEMREKTMNMLTWNIDFCIKRTTAFCTSKLTLFYQKIASLFQHINFFSYYT